MQVDQLQKTRSSDSIISIWRIYLSGVLRFYETKRGSLWWFYPLLFFFFFLINVACYWWAMVTAYPELAFGAETRFHYFLVQFPVGALGALFDSLSFFATIYIVRRALASSTTFSYLGHLSIDLVVAAAATCWVLFVFSFSGWIIGNYEKSMAARKAAVVSTNVSPEPKAVDTLAVRNQIYQKKLVDAVQNPSKPEHIKNIYFGFLMGVSAMFPTLTHLFLSLWSVAIFLYRKSLRSQPAQLS